MNKEEILKLFDSAIKREMEANEFYSAASKKVKDKSVQEIFADLARDELGHKELLERFKASPTLDFKISAPANDFKIAEVTVLPTLSINLKPADAIALAMKKEQQAVEFYLMLSRATSDIELKGIFENLSNMEKGHKHRLETIFVEIGYPESF